MNGYGDFALADCTPLTVVERQSTEIISDAVGTIVTDAPLSTDSAEDDSSLFVCFIDTMARSDPSRAYAFALRLGAFANRPLRAGYPVSNHRSSTILTGCSGTWCAAS